MNIKKKVEELTAAATLDSNGILIKNEIKERWTSPGQPSGSYCTIVHANLQKKHIQICKSISGRVRCFLRDIVEVYSQFV